MKTTIHRTIDKIFQGAAILGLSSQFLFSEVAYGQQAESLQFYPTTEKEASSSSELTARIFPSFDPLKLKVVFFNPEKETVALIIRNDLREIVYKKVIEKTESYNSNYDVSHLPDGIYTFEVYSKVKSFSKSFQISTQLTRLTYVE